MTPEERIDAALESILKAAGSELSFYRKDRLDRMREAMRKIMSEEYLAGSHDNFKAMKNLEKIKLVERMSGLYGLPSRK